MYALRQPDSSPASASTAGRLSRPVLLGRTSASTINKSAKSCTRPSVRSTRRARSSRISVRSPLIAAARSGSGPAAAAAVVAAASVAYAAARLAVPPPPPGAPAAAAGVPAAAAASFWSRCSSVMSATCSNQGMRGTGAGVSGQVAASANNSRCAACSGLRVGMCGTGLGVAVQSINPNLQPDGRPS